MKINIIVCSITSRIIVMSTTQTTRTFVVTCNHSSIIGSPEDEAAAEMKEQLQQSKAILEMLENAAAEVRAEISAMEASLSSETQSSSKYRMLTCGSCSMDFKSRYRGNKEPMCSSCHRRQHHRPVPCHSCGENDCQVYPNCFEPATDPKTPPPGANPHCCSQCGKQTKVDWTYNPYTYDVGNMFVYNWWCRDCYNEACADI